MKIVPGKVSLRFDFIPISYDGYQRVNLGYEQIGTCPELFTPLPLSSLVLLDTQKRS